MLINTLETKEYNSYYQLYLDQIPANTSLLEGYQRDFEETSNFFLSLPENKLLFRYAENKWSCQEILQHLIDTERIFIHRCFRIARGETQNITGFNQDDYLPPAGADSKSLTQLLEEFSTTRNYSKNLLQSLTDDALRTIGTANQSAMSARAAAFVVLGHNQWHKQIIKTRYLSC